MGESVSNEVIVASCFLGCFFFAYAFIVIVLRHLLMKRWKEIDGLMIKLKDDQGPNLRYTYKIDGVEFVGNRLLATDALPLHKEMASKFLEDKRANTHAAVYVSSTNPAASCLDRSVNSRVLLIYAGASISMLAIALLAMRTVYSVAPLVAFSLIIALIAAVNELIRYTLHRSKPCQAAMERRD